jgi:hypothetical protein
VPRRRQLGVDYACLRPAGEDRADRQLSSATGSLMELPWAVLGGLAPLLNPRPFWALWAPSWGGLPAGEFPAPVTSSRSFADGKEPGDHTSLPVSLRARSPATARPSRYTSPAAVRPVLSTILGLGGPSCSGVAAVPGYGGRGGPGAAAGGPGRAPDPGLGICLRFAYVHERDVIQWTVSNTYEHGVRTQNDAVDTFALPCKQGVPGSSPGVGSVSSQVRGAFYPAPLAPIRPGFAYGFAYERLRGRRSGYSRAVRPHGRARHGGSGSQ